MMRNSKNSWLQNNIFKLNILTLLLYGIGFYLSKVSHFNLLFNFIGTIYLLFITPINTLLIFRLRLQNLTEYLLASLVIFFTIITPLYYIINLLFNIPFTFELLFSFAIITSIAAIALYYNGFFYQPMLRVLLNISLNTLLKKILIKHWPIILIILLYLAIHYLNYYFYIFIPEWDGYSSLLNFKEIISTSRLDTNYRGFFTVATILIFNFTKISLYDIFTYLFIILQVAIPLSVYLSIKSIKITKKLPQFILLLTTLSIPVINMEIDTIRPQNTFLILLPVYIYFIKQALSTKKITYWILSSLIAIFGLNYHEFFIFILILHLFLILSLLFKLYKRNHKTHFSLLYLLPVSILSGLLLLHFFPMLKGLIYTFKNIFLSMLHFSNWRWWFLNDYSADSSGQQLGWPGISGAIKYYSYYTSPVILFILLTTLFLAVKKQLFLSKQLLLRIILPLLLLLLAYTELLPRLGYIYLPERIWVAIDILTIFIALPIYKIIQQNYPKKIVSSFLSIILILNLIGIGGSLYIANQKKALTSKNEFTAAQWIKENTPKNSLFITQPANGPMIKYFAERKISSTPVNFFDTGIHTEPANNLLANKQKNKSQSNNQLATRIIKRDKLLPLLKVNNSQLKYSKAHTKKINTKSNSEPFTYAIFSNDKFKGLYAQREWWLKANHYGAKIENLTKKYPLVYNKDGIYIWKIK